MQPLDRSLRIRLESTVKEARETAEMAARAALEQLGVGETKPFDHLGESDKDLRRRLRVHGRQLGDSRNAKGEQEIDALVGEVAYEHWHRMLFARFLAENDLLMYPDPVNPVPVTLGECDDLAADEGAANGWELAARFAARMLPQVFRPDSPVFQLTLPPEHQQKLERLLSDLPPEVFKASDSLGWVYQFWQAKEKEAVNASETKIGARELPAVTQLFTEPYMVSFLLDNSLGAWWASKRLTFDDLKKARSEEELRQKAAIPGVPLSSLRFVKQEDETWTPAAGTFDAWPKRLTELKVLDPCCGSGHFLVAALLRAFGEPVREFIERRLTLVTTLGVVGIVGGFLLEHYWWGSAFLMAVPVLVLLLILAPIFVPESRDPNPGAVDVVSIALSLLTMVPLVYAIKSIAHDGPSAAALGLVVLGRRLRRAAVGLRASHGHGRRLGEAADRAARASTEPSPQ